MPSISIKTPTGQIQTVKLFKRITSFGRGSDNDIIIQDPVLPETAFAFIFDGSSYTVDGETKFYANGKATESHVLQPHDVLKVGNTELTFAMVDTPEPELLAQSDFNVLTQVHSAAPERELTALRRLIKFSEYMFTSYDIDRLLEILMDECISITRADKGFLILLESNQLRIKIARNLERENIEHAIEQVSDSIVAKVVAQKAPLIIRDALDDPEFKTAESVVNFKLLSVMCVPLMYKGELFGLIYLGNDRLINRFDQQGLNTLIVFATQAALMVQNALLVNELKLENVTLKTRLEAHVYGDIIGACRGMRDVYERIDKIAPTDISVLVYGETGTGKELIAKELHRRSSRARGPFISINCGAIPENLLESELFGHVRGAFTGAVATKLGKFQAATGGTLFLDEIGDMPFQLQVKLLRVLQEKVVCKVGDNRMEPVDIRVIVATHKNLDAETKKGLFREDLYFRINVVTLQLPLLRDRGDDILMLAKFFLNRYSVEFRSKARGFTQAGAAAMKRYHWPGNIRELENRIKTATVLAEKPLLGPAELNLHNEHLPPILSLTHAKEDFQRRYISEVLERNGGNRTKTAKDLGVDPRTIFRHLEKLETDKDTADMT